MTTTEIAPSSYFGEPIHSGYVLISRAHLANVTSLEHERWERAYASSAVGSGSSR